MAIRTTAPKSIDEYIAASPSEVQPILKKIRLTISAAAPGAQELISYRMPAFRLRGILVYFAAFKTHVVPTGPVSQTSAPETDSGWPRLSRTAGQRFRAATCYPPPHAPCRCSL